MKKSRNAGPSTPQTKRRRHSAFGWAKGSLTIAHGVDLTEPACPEWADIAEQSSIELAKMIEEGKAGKK